LRSASYGSRSSQRSRGDDFSAGSAGRLYSALCWLLKRPKDAIALGLAVCAAGAIIVNALFLQSGPHPAPMFHMQSNARTVQKLVQLPRPAPAPRDPIAEIIEAPDRVISVQRALTEFGYGQIRPDGKVGQETKAAIERFERDHHLPVTGKISDQLAEKLATLTGRPI